MELLKKIERAKSAKDHVKYCDKHFAKAIGRSVHKSLYYEDLYHAWKYDPLMEASDDHHKYPPVSTIVEKDTVSALFDCGYINDGYKATILNFASYTNPGGGFLKGANAQEENLCAESNLYSVLRDFDKFRHAYSRNRENLDNHMYTNRAIYSPDIIFTRVDPEAEFIETTTADVITCAAPNFTRGKTLGVTQEYNDECFKDRVNFLFSLIKYIGRRNMALGNEKYYEKRILILGAWGCGVFGQDIEKLAKYYAFNIYNKRREMANQFESVIFAIPDADKVTKFSDAFEKAKYEAKNNSSEWWK